jgi:tetratricopeptide (TPR) repeat protein
VRLAGEDVDPRAGAGLHFNLGRARQAVGDLRGAEEAYGRAVELDPGLARAWNNRGTVRTGTGDYAGAVSDLDRAAELSPRDAVVFFNRAVARENQGVYDKALAPDFGAAYHNRGVLRLREGAAREACADLEQACDLGYCTRYESLKELGTCP